uniref:TRIM7 ligase n=1 Tax=Dromaius novaehollandiae TaxID=8790 RepID=A0A8C4JXW7_DRONO
FPFEPPFSLRAAMAERDPLESLRREASCSICLDYFSDPVSINCGHSFCRDCITRCSGKAERRFACPQCRGVAQKRKFRPNRELRNLAEIAKTLSREKRLKDLSQKNIVLKEALRKFKANVTLDPDTANPHLVLSADRRSFTAGRHYWEVQLGSRGFWAVGVARDSAWRKGWISLAPSQGIWAVGICGDEFQAFTSFETIQPLNGRPRTIRISLDYERGHVAFFDADNETLAFAFSPASFNGERILPFFWMSANKQQNLISFISGTNSDTTSGSEKRAKDAPSF